MSRFWTALYTRRPSPPAPMMAAMPIMAIDMSSVWLRPVMRAGRASGNWTSVSTRNSVAPYARLASTTSSGTCLMPRLVRRISGGRANTIVTMVPGTTPMLQKKITGSMYTKACTTCMASRMGRTTFQTESRRPQRIPRGTPTMAHRTTATRTMPTVRTVSIQYSVPSSPQRNIPRPAATPTFGVRTRAPRTTVASTTQTQGISARNLSTKFSRRKANGQRMASSSHPRLASIQSTIWSTHAPNGISHWSRIVASKIPTSSACKPDWARTPLTGTPPARSRL